MIAKVVVTALLALLMGFAGSIKLVGVKQSLEIRDHFGVKPMQWRVIGSLELAGVAGILAGLSWAPIGILRLLWRVMMASPADAWDLSARVT